MVGFKERAVVIGGHSHVYYNLHKHTFSMKQKGKIVLHSDCIIIHNAKFVVQKAGRKRVLEEQRKNVHAFVVGEYYPGAFHDIKALKRGYREAYYNPYKYPTFVDKETLEPVHEAEMVILKDKRIFYK